MKINKTLSILVLILLNFVFLQTSLSANPKEEWLQVRTKNFNLIGNASEKDIRKAATKLEQFRETFSKLFKNANLNSGIPTNVVVFKSASAYKPFQPKRANGKTDTNIAGYFMPGEDVNYITLSTEGEEAETYGTIFHEYVHFIVNTTFGKSEVPPWFNEGLAEYYQTFEIKDDQKVNLGLLQQGHLNLLSQTKLIPLDTLFKISNYALHENGDHSRSIFYAESWALMHYLIQGGKTDNLGKFLLLLMQNVAPEKAFQDAFQTTYEQMEKELRKYVEQNSYKYLTITLKNKLLFDSEMQVSPLAEAETDAYLGDLLYHMNRQEDAEPFLQKAVALDPNSSMANTAFGMLKIRQRKFDEAKNYLEKAISGDQKNHLAFYRYAYLLSREERDEFGYVSSFPADKSARMREMLKKAIAINPGFTESYELLAFVNMVNHEQLDEAISYLQKALKYQPGNQRYALRIAEIYMRQDKFSEAAAIAGKIAKTADEPEIKSQAENLAEQVRKRQEYAAANGQENGSRREYQTTVSDANKNTGAPTLNRRQQIEKTLTPEEAAKIEEDSKIRAVASSLKKPSTNEKQVIARILKIECKGKSITYTVKAGAETFTLFSKDFESLEIQTFVADAENLQVGCGSKVDDFNSVLIFKPQNDPKTGTTARGELVAIDFVPRNFRFMEPAGGGEEAQNETAINYPPEVSSAPDRQDSDARRREAMMRGIKNALRPLGEGEKRELAFIEKIECTKDGLLFHFKTQAETIKLSAASPQAIQIRAFTPEVEQVRFGCGLKQVEIPAVITYKVDLSLTAKAYGQLIAMEFVPKSFVLEK